MSRRKQIRGRGGIKKQMLETLLQISSRTDYDEEVARNREGSGE
jgi:hypothetical protein